MQKSGAPPPRCEDGQGWVVGRGRRVGSPPHRCGAQLGGPSPGLVCDGDVRQGGGGEVAGRRLRWPAHPPRVRLCLLEHRCRRKLASLNPSLLCVVLNNTTRCCAETPWGVHRSCMPCGTATAAAWLYVVAGTANDGATKGGPRPGKGGRHTTARGKIVGGMHPRPATSPANPHQKKASEQQGNLHIHHNNETHAHEKQTPIPGATNAAEREVVWSACMGRTLRAATAAAQTVPAEYRTPRSRSQSREGGGRWGRKRRRGPRDRGPQNTRRR